MPFPSSDLVGHRDPAAVLAWARTRPDWFGTDVAHVSPGGRGESFLVWRVHAATGDTALHVPRAATVVPRVAALTHALRRAPAGVGPRLIGADSAGHYVTTWLAGTTRAPAAWRAADRARLARLLARLHRVVPAGTRPGPVTPGGTDEARELVAELDRAQTYWRGHDPAVLDPPTEALALRLRTLLRAVDDANGPPGVVLCHGDPSAGNVVWPDAVDPDPVLIDWEWARFGDPARDLALLGGAVAADPWYAALAPSQVRAFVTAYVEAGGLGDVDALVARRDAWLLLATFTDTLYLRSLERAGAATSAHRATRGELLRGLARALDR